MNFRNHETKTLTIKEKTIEFNSVEELVSYGIASIFTMLEASYSKDSMSNLELPIIYIIKELFNSWKIESGLKNISINEFMDLLKTHIKNMEKIEKQQN